MRRNWLTLFACLVLSVGTLLADGNITVDSGDIGWTSEGFSLDGSAIDIAGYFRMTQTSTQSISNTGVTTLDFDTTVFDNLSGADLALNLYEIQDAGYYHFTAGGDLTSVTAASQVGIRITVNGTDVVTNEKVTATSEGSPVITTTYQGYLSAGDKVAARMDQGDSTSRSTSGAATRVYFFGTIITGVRAGIPVGSIQAYAGATVPGGWLDCDGSAVSRTVYANLFVAIGTTWGIGDGSTTFNLPDFRGSTLIGTGTGSGLTTRSLADTGGKETHQLSVAEMPQHRHSQYTYLGNTVIAGCDADASCSVGPYTRYTNYTGSSVAHETMQPFAAVTYLIKH